jgi:ABC-type lipoprotein export system ATPase subunit
VDTSDVLLELVDVSKEYPSAPAPTRVLNGVNLRVKAGETLAIVGPSGCGKSTLLNLIGTLDDPTSGHIFFVGRDVQGQTETERARFRNESIGFVFQLHHLLPQCSALENVLVPTLVHRTGGQAHARATALLQRVGLADQLDRLPGELSGGERQRVAVARALINGPRMLLADEPTGSLSREGAEDLARLLLELNRDEGTALIVVTHSSDVARMMGTVLTLRDGRLLPHEGSVAP